MTKPTTPKDKEKRKVNSAKTLLQNFADWISENREQKYKVHITHKVFLIERLK